MTAHGITLSQSSILLWDGDKMPSGITLEGYSLLPSVYADSLIFETQLSRECSKLADSYLNQIYYRDSLLEESAKLIDLQSGVIESQNQIIEDWPKEVRANAEICSQQKVKLKQKIRRLWRVVFIESGVIVVLVVILI
jgi:hypothetical protein